MNWKWWLTAPRHIGNPNKIVCQTKQDMAKMYNLMNGNVNKLYVGLYQCDQTGNFENVTLDVIAHDIDWDSAYDTVMELHKKLMKIDYVHQVMFSTRGFWVYTACIPRTYPRAVAKMKLAAMQDWILEDTTILFGKASDAPIDVSVRGDISRITRFPSSKDKERNRYAIFLDDSDLEKGMEHIMSLSTNCSRDRRFQIITFGTKIEIDPDKFNVIKIKPRIADSIIDEEKFKTTYVIPEGISEQHKKILSSFPDFIQGWVVDKELAVWQARAYVTLYMREKGFTKDQVEHFLKPFYEKHLRTDHLRNNWEHYIKVAQCSDHIFRRKDLKFPSYKTLVDLGLCPHSYVEKFGPYASAAYR